MGKASRRKAEFKKKFSEQARKDLKLLRKNSRPEEFIDGNGAFYNPMKKIARAENYNSDSGQSAMDYFVRRTLTESENLSKVEKKIQEEKNNE